MSLDFIITSFNSSSTNNNSDSNEEPEERSENQDNLVYGALLGGMALLLLWFFILVRLLNKFRAQEVNSTFVLLFFLSVTILPICIFVTFITLGITIPLTSSVRKLFLILASYSLILFAVPFAFCIQFTVNFLVSIKKDNADFRESLDNCWQNNSTTCFCSFCCSTSGPNSGEEFVFDETVGRVNQSTSTVDTFLR